MEAFGSDTLLLTPEVRYRSGDTAHVCLLHVFALPILTDTKPLCLLIRERFQLRQHALHVCLLCLLRLALGNNQLLLWVAPGVMRGGVL